ncbi:MAG: RagB/SusD family nutrient uptake outer membrane protein, partial [Muribaculaceae bacterium]|nr:RagB/SusD family nutrient uptake outer membrane protein [Muribaculaceae bacterium]
MKIKNIFLSSVATLSLTAGLTSCDYLDVMPPEQPSVDNTMDSYSSAEGYLYTAYRYVTQPIASDWAQGMNTSAGQPLPGLTLGDYQGTTDEWLMDDVQYNQGPLVRGLYTNTLSANNNFNDYKVQSIALSNVYLFLEKLNTIGVPNGVVPEETAELWRAEAKFLIAYYHYCLLRRYGPIAIVDKRMSMDASVSSFPGRMHYDYCVKWICDQLDEAAKELPARREVADTGRATSTICKALKARVLLYAASPLFNGQFPYPEWTNKVETPGYGTELVSKTYDRNKWETARKASEEALELALGDGQRSLYYGSGSNESDQMIKATYVPVDGADEDFKRAVLRMRNVICVREPDGNSEHIWATYDLSQVGADWNQRMPRNPIPKTASAPNGYQSAYCTMGATLATNLRFLTKDGYQPENDPNFTPESDWYKSAGYADDYSDASNPALRSHIINLCKNREPRFYAWLSFDGGDYGTLFRYGNGPVHMNLLSSQAQGYDPVIAPRDYCPTGFLMQKWISPKGVLNTSGGA